MKEEKKIIRNKEEFHKMQLEYYFTNERKKIIDQAELLKQKQR